ncbi:MAG: glycoside hydrolase family 3 C-terminal domain-containing protein [Lachnospiraceae bacterium]|nr:glycoside hydrolase family 3 C-terminal domain-containing protein [Lachnospiraceae bacterium]
MENQNGCSLLKERAKSLTAMLTLEEKIGMIHGAHLFSTQGVERLGIPPLVMSDGPMGVRQEFEPDCWKAVGSSDDYVTYLPCNSALAATWNRDLAFATGSVLGAEARGRGKDIILAPGINIKRSPLCGRNFEYFSEDPYLTGELAVCFIQGIQQWDVAACVKHFAANNQETQRLWVDVEIDENALREIYLPAFYACLTRGKSLSVMGAYNKLYGEHCCQSQYLLHDILRREWSYEGVVVSDWGGVHDTELAATSELDIEMSVTDNFDEYYMADPLKKAVEQGSIPEDRIDEKVTRILTLMMQLHMMDDGEKTERKSGAYNVPGHRQTALDTARESIVLLKNERKILPLDAKRLQKVLLVGENAQRLHANGGGSAEMKALYEISPLMGIKMLLGGNVKVDFTRGYQSGAKKPEDGVNWQEKSLEDGGGHGRENQKENQNLAQERAALRREAVEMAKAYETVIYVGGLNHDYDSEGIDRSDMSLPYEQDLLIQELLRVKPDMVVVLIGGSPVEMGAWIDRAPAVVWSYYAGMEGGTAIAEVLFGSVNPSGRLPETFYKSHKDCSAHRIGEFAGEKKVSYREGVFVGYRFNETFGVEPEFCFGHGLSYTCFEYENAVYEASESESYLTCTITNVGERAGAEIVQVYRMAQNQDLLPIPENISELPKIFPSKELIGFGKIYLEPGETGQMKIAVKGKTEPCVFGIANSVKSMRRVEQAQGWWIRPMIRLFRGSQVPFLV